MHKFEYIQSTGSSLWHSGLRVRKMFIPPNLNGNQSLLLWNWHYCLSDAWACLAVTPQLFSPDNNTNSQRNAKKHAAWLSITSAHNSLASVFILTECTSASSNRSPEIWILDPEPCSPSPVSSNAPISGTYAAHFGTSRGKNTWILEKTNLAFL